MVPTMASPQWMPIPILQPLPQLAGQAIIQGRQPSRHRRRATHGVAAARRHVRFEPVQRHQSVAGELRVVATGFPQCFRHLGKELIQDKYHIVGKTLLAELGGCAQVDEHHRHRLLVTADATGSLGVGSAGVGGQQRGDVQVARGTCLARQPHIVAGADTLEGRGLDLAGCRQVLETRSHPHPAGGAAGAAAANGRMGYARHAQRFEDGLTRPGDDGSGRRMREGVEVLTPVPHLTADLAGRQHQHQ